MSIIRTHKKECPFVQIDRRSIEDTRLSFRARGLHAYLMSKTDGWNVYLKHLAKQSNKEGIAAVTKAMKELIALGYAVRTREKDAHGRFHGWATDVYEYPETIPPNSEILSSEILNSEDRGSSLYSKEDNIGFNPSLPFQQKDVAAEDSLPYTTTPQEVSRGGGEGLDAASRPGHNMVTRGDALLGEAEGEYSPHPRDNSEHPQSTQEPQDKAPELDSSDRGKTRKTRHIEDEAQEVLAHLNRITGRSLEKTGLIPARLKEGRTVAECTLILDWMVATWSTEYVERSVNYTSPFRPSKFELYLDSAQRWGWTQQPKTPSPTPSPATPGEATTAVPDDLMAMINTTIPERSPHATR